MLLGMKAPLFVRELTWEECQQLEAGLHSKRAFTLKRCQILLASSVRQTVKQIAERLGFAATTIRHVIHAFNARGLAALQERSHVPTSLHPVLTADKREQLHTILHHSPRTYGKNRSTWTLKLLAEVACEQGLSEHVLSEPTLLDAVRRLNVSWKRAKHWISSPDPAYTRKKTVEIG
jgi:transposase